MCETYGAYALAWFSGHEAIHRFYKRHAKAIWTVVSDEAYDAGTTLWEQLVTLSEWAKDDTADSRFLASYDDILQAVTAWALWVVARDAAK